MEHIGDQIRGMRKAAKVTQGELAMNCQVSRTHLSNVEAGRAEPSYKLVERMVNYLGFGIHFYLKIDQS